MNCSFGSVDEIATCLYQAKAWFSLFEGILGLVSGGLTAALLMLIKWRNDDREEFAARLADKDKEIQVLQERLRELGDDEYVVGLVTEIGKVVRNWSHPKVTRAPNIPKDKDTLARRKAQIPGEDDLVALMDFTRLGIMTHFLAVTYNGLYWTGAVTVPWEAFVASDINIGDTTVHVGEYAPIKAGGGISAEALGNMLVGLHTALKPYFEVQNAGEAEENEPLAVRA